MRAVDDILRAGRRGTVGLERIHQLASDGGGIPHRGEDGRRALQGVVDDPVEQVLDGPGEFGDVGGADHAAGTLERVERAAHAGQRLGFQRVLLPGREQLGDARHLFPRLLYI